MVSSLDFFRPSRRSDTLSFSRMFVIAILLNLMTDACQFSEYSSLSAGTGSSFFVNAQFGGGFGGGGGRRFQGGGGQRFGGGGGRSGGRRPPPK